MALTHPELSNLNSPAMRVPLPHPLFTGTLCVLVGSFYFTHSDSTPAAQVHDVYGERNAVASLGGEVYVPLVWWEQAAAPDYRPWKQKGGQDDYELFAITYRGNNRNDEEYLRWAISSHGSSWHCEDPVPEPAATENGNASDEEDYSERVLAHLRSSLTLPEVHVQALVEDDEPTALPGRWQYDIYGKPAAHAGMTSAERDRLLEQIERILAQALEEQ